jgi:hypothetical protein
VSYIRETLDQLDRRLGELRRQVAALVEDPQPPETLAPPPGRRLAAVPPEPAPLRTPPEAPAPTLAGPPVPTAETEIPHRPAIDPSATAAADGDPGHVSGQIQELMSVRDQLLSGARELVRAYERQLDLLENMSVSGLRGGPEAVASSTAAHRGAVAEAEEDARPAFFEGTVTLLVAGAGRIQTIQVLEDSLSRARHVEDVYVRRCHRGRVWIELSLSAGAELLGEFNRVLPFPFAVSSAAAKEIALTLEGEQ